MFSKNMQNDLRREVVLCGGYRAFLNQIELNEWEEFCQVNVVYLRYVDRVGEAFAILARQNGTDLDLVADVEGGLKNQEVAHQRMYLEAKAWCVNKAKQLDKEIEQLVKYPKP